MKAKIKKTIKVLTIILVLFITGVMIINTAPFDETLNPEIKKILKERSDPAVEGNAYYAIFGMTTESNDSLTEAGFNNFHKQIEERRQLLNKSSEPDESLLIEQTLTADSTWMQQYQTCSSKEENDCLSRMKEQILQTPLENKRLLLLFDRYQELISMDNFENAQLDLLEVPFPPYGTLMKLSQIFLAQNYMTLSSENFLKQLNRDMQFWKLVLTQGEYLIDKMVAQSALRNDMYALSYWVNNTKNISSQELTTINNCLNAINLKDLNLSESFKAEARMTLNFYATVELNQAFYDKIFYQPNATMNEYYNNHITKQIEMAQLPLEELLKVRDENKMSKNEHKRSFKFTDLYNFIGKMINAYSGCACDDYIVRGTDLINIIKMVSIQLQAKLSTTEDLQDILIKSDNHNIYNNKAFDYDELSGNLSFECLDRFSKCLINIE